VPEGFHAPLNIGGLDVMAFIDTGANVSCFSQSFVERANLQSRVKPPKRGETDHINGFDEDHQTPRIGTVTCAIIAHKRGEEDHEFEVINSTDEVIIGTDLFEFIGITLHGVPFQFPDGDKGRRAFNEAATAEEDLRKPIKPWDVEDRINAKDFAWLANAIAPELRANAALDPAQPACSTIPEATFKIPLNLPAGQGSFRHQYSCPLEAQPAMDHRVTTWHQEGVTERGNASSNFNSAVLAVKKKSLSGEKTDWRICIDFRHINALLTETFGHARDRMPHLAEALAKAKGFTIASSLDLKDSFHQFEVDEPDRDKTTFTHKGQRWRFARWPFGLNPASLRFQKIMEVVLEGLEDSTIVWIDDTLVYTIGTVAEHAAALKEVLRRLNNHGLRINADKCHFGFSRVLMLGHFLSGTTNAIDPLKARTAATWPLPTTGKDIERLMGFGNFVRGYVPCYSRITSALEPLKKIKSFVLEDHPAAEQAFFNLRKALGDTPVLQQPDPELPLFVATDASRLGLGAVLYQVDLQGKTRYIAFASTSLKGAQKNYGATKRELLGIIFGLRSFHNYLCGRRFTLFTDHKALTALFTVRHLSYVLQDWIDTLLQYDFDCVHRPGVEMILPDTLSRLFENDGGHEEQPEQTRIIDAIRKDEDDRALDIAANKAPTARAMQHITVKQLKKLTTTPSTGLRQRIRVDELAVYPERELAALINERFSKVCPKPEQREQLLSTRHASGGHFGAESLYKETWRAGYFWPGLRKQCAEVVSRCRSCVQYNVVAQGFHPTHSLQAENPFDHIAVDTLEMPATSDNGFKYILIVVDVMTRYLITRPLKTHTMEEMANVLFEIFSTFGPPKIMQSDNGTEFINQLVAELCLQANVEHRTAAPFNPRSNGLAETYVGTFKQVLKKSLAGNLRTWDIKLPPKTLNVNMHEGKLSKTAPFTMFYSRTANPWCDYTVGEILGPDAQALQQAKLEEALDQLPEYDVLQLEEQKARLQDLKMVAHSAVKERVKQAQQIKNSALDKKRLSVARKIPIGAIVFIINEDYAAKFEPLYIGPFTVHRRSEKSKCYYLIDVDGEHLGRPIPISKIKQVSDQNVALFDNDGKAIELAQERGIVKTILKHKSEDNKDMYLVQWKDASEPNEWLSADAFDDPSAVGNFWRRLQPTRKRKRDAKPQQQQPDEQSETSESDEDFTGRQLEIPATWWSTAYAKETYGSDYKKTKEAAVVTSKAKGKGLWNIKQPKSATPEQEFIIREDAIELYAS
jgi:transposase InsO family protein